MEEMIGMADMGLIFEVTDALEIDREVVRVELTKEDPGSVKVVSGGLSGQDSLIEIVVPQSTPLDEWLPTLEAALKAIELK